MNSDLTLTCRGSHLTLVNFIFKSLFEYNVLVLCFFKYSH